MNLNFVGQLFDTHGKLKPQECIKHQFLLKNNMQFQYRQIIHALPQHWKETIKQFAGNLNNFYIKDHHLIKCNTIFNLEKLNTARSICFMNAHMHKIYGTNLDYIFQKKLYYQF